MDSLSNDGGESVANIRVRSSDLGPIEIQPEAIAGLIDELPVLAVLGAAAEGIRIRGAGELRLKESDRIHAVVTNLRSIGVVVEEFDDGLLVKGGEVISRRHCIFVRRSSCSYGLSRLRASYPTLVWKSKTQLAWTYRSGVF